MVYMKPTGAGLFADSAQSVLFLVELLPIFRRHPKVGLQPVLIRLSAGFDRVLLPFLRVVVGMASKARVLVFPTPFSEQSVFFGLPTPATRLHRDSTE